MDLSVLRAWIVLKKHLLFWVVRCGRMTLALKANKFNDSSSVRECRVSHR